MKKITFLMLHLNYGGIEKQVTTLANNLCKEYEVEIIALYNILGTSFYKLNENIKVRYILTYGPNKKDIKDAIKKFRPLKLLKELYKTLKILYTKYIVIGKIANKIDTDIIISSRIEFSKQLKRYDILTISQEHSYNNSKNYIKKVRRSFKHIKYLVVMTEKAKKDYDFWFQNVKNKPEVIIIPNIIEESLEISRLDSNQIISVGRLEEIKDFDSLIDVFKLVNDKNPKWTLKIVGEGSKRLILEEKVRKLDLQEKVFFTGTLNKENIIREFLNSSIYVLTSKNESFSLSLCEAMSYGLPSISFDIDVGPKEIIRNNEDGFIIEDRNKIKMAEKICLLIKDNELRIKIARNAKTNVARFYPKNILKIWKNILN